MSATTKDETLAELKARTPAQWDAAYVRYVRNRLAKGHTLLFTREEYPQRCIDWLMEAP